MYTGGKCNPTKVSGHKFLFLFAHAHILYIPDRRSTVKAWDKTSKSTRITKICFSKTTILEQRAMDDSKRFKPFLLCHEDGGLPAWTPKVTDVWFQPTATKRHPGKWDMVLRFVPSFLHDLERPGWLEKAMFVVGCLLKR